MSERWSVSQCGACGTVHAIPVERTPVWRIDHGDRGDGDPNFWLLPCGHHVKDAGPVSADQAYRQGRIDAAKAVRTEGERQGSYGATEEQLWCFDRAWKLALGETVR